MNDFAFELNDLRIEISFKSLSELRNLLSFCQQNNLLKLNLPCKNYLKKEFLLTSIKISREEYPDFNIIPHYSVAHQFSRNSKDTQKDLIQFIKFVEGLGCKEILLISGSQKKATLDSVKALNNIKNTPLYKDNVFFGVAFNPYLPEKLFEEELNRLKLKINSGLVSSIWFQFGTDFELLERRISLLENIISNCLYGNTTNPNIFLYGSIFIPSKMFLARFKFRPWKGVYCSPQFLESVDFANEIVVRILSVYKKYNIYPIVESNISTDSELKSLKNLVKL